ncbi:MAG: histidine kinase N-terminal domain-containing protein [bacterium]|nr:histidine kinase N-terminal domain-containing protein [bacterium]MCY4272033.1 histidine kinase N-terminal domain-containing protein [bacterium]
MASLEDLAPGLAKSRLNHLKRLMRTWAPLADISFADLLLYVPVYMPVGPAGGHPTGYAIAGQIRPTTARSVHYSDLVGSVYSPEQRPLVDVAFREGRMTDGGRIGRTDQSRIRTLAVPVNCHGEVVAVMAREFDPDTQRNPGELEMSYFKLFRRLAAMIAEGEYPFPVDDIETEESPRVGDGLMLLDASGRVQLISPNAASALHRIGLHGDAEGSRLVEIGLEQRAIRAAFASRLPQTEEIQHGDRGTVVLRCLPLLGRGEITGALVLMRDISELRRRDRLLMSKDATIAEIHHRVKNNLQTVSSLLRLQGRRAVAAEARDAIEESVRRIRAIAVVHEILSRDASGDVPFVEIVRSLVRMVEEGLTGPDRPVEFKVAGDAGELGADVATPLAVVLNECLQNVMDHAYPEPPGGRVQIELGNDGERVRVRVTDDGVGLPPGFDMDSADGLGIAIVRNLVSTDLGGSLTMSSGDVGLPRPGTVVEVAIPLLGSAPRQAAGPG